MNYKLTTGIMLDLHEKEFKVLRDAIFNYEMEIKSGAIDWVSEKESEILGDLSAEFDCINEHLQD
jgi:hypothetical protein